MNLITANLMPTAEGDVFFTQDGDLVLLTGAEAVLAHIKQRLSFIRGKYFANRNYGLPYFDEIMGRLNSNKLLIAEAIIKNEILTVPGVRSFVETPVFEWNAHTRIMRFKKACVWIECDQSMVQLDIAENGVLNL